MSPRATHWEASHTLPNPTQSRALTAPAEVLRHPLMNMQRQSFTYKRNWYSHYGLWLIKPPFTSLCFENLHQENVLLSKLSTKDLVPLQNDCLEASLLRSKVPSWFFFFLLVGCCFFFFSLASYLISYKIQANHSVEGRLESCSHITHLKKLKFTHHTHTHSYQILLLDFATASWKISKLGPRKCIIERLTTFTELYRMSHQYSFFIDIYLSHSCLPQETWSRINRKHEEHYIPRSYWETKDQNSPF